MRLEFNIEGIDCPHCAEKIETALKESKGIKNAKIDFLQKKVVLETRISEETAIQIIKQIANQYEPYAEVTKTNEIKNSKKKSRSITILFQLLICFLFTCVGFFFDYSPTMSNHKLAVIAYILAFTAVGTDVIDKAIQNLIHGHLLDENCLMAIATIGAGLTGHAAEAIAVMFIYNIGELFQQVSSNKARKDIEELTKLKIESSQVLKDGEFIETKSEDIKIGDILLIKPGNKIPVDGTITKGTSSINTANITGEFNPSRVKENDTVLSGCINESNSFEMRADKIYEDSTATQIIKMLQDPNGRKAKTERFITKFARIYTPIVILMAIIVSLTLPYIYDISLTDSIYRALQFLVISCPCALILSIPLAFFLTVGSASKKGILIKDYESIENLSKIKAFAFDKTGTLTEGRIEIKNKIQIDENLDLFEMIAAIEKHSTHPIARALSKDCMNKYTASNIKEIPGLGITGDVAGKSLLVGNKKLMQENHIEIPEDKDINIFVSYNGIFAGGCLISDKIRDDSKETIHALKKKGINEFIMLTGDKKETAEQIGSELGMTRVFSELLPVDKLALLENMVESNHVAYVGDGLNDAPAMKNVGVGIAMGGIGSDATVEVADVIIMKDDLLKLPDILKLSRKTMRIIKENIVLTLVVKILFLVLSALGMSSMFLSIFADVGVMLIAVLNSLRCHR